MLILLALRELLLRADSRTPLAWLGAGVAGGLVVCALGLASFTARGAGLWIEAGLTLVLGITLAATALGTMVSAESIRRHASDLLEHQLGERHAGLLVAGFAAFSTAREAMELVLFARAIAPRFPADSTAWGLSLGLLACGLLVPAWRWLKVRAGMLQAFRLSALYLLFMSIQMTIHGGAMLLLSGLLPLDERRLALALEPYLHGGSRHWLLCAVLLAPPIAFWLKTWWRRSATTS